MSDLPEWARRLDLSPHPEGGWFRETWRSGLIDAPIRAAARLHRPAQRRHGNPVPAHARSAVGMAHGAQRGTVAIPLRRSAAAPDWSRTGQCHNAFAWRRYPRRGTPADCRSAGTLATCPSSRRRTLPGQLCRDTGIRLRRLRVGRAYRLSNCTAAATRAALSTAVEPSGSSSVSSIPMRVCTPQAPACSSSGQQLSFMPCSSTGAGDAGRQHLAEQVVGGRDITVWPQFDHHPHAVRSDLRSRPRLGRLGVEDARLDADAPGEQQVGERRPSPAHASSPMRNRATRSTPSTARNRSLFVGQRPEAPSSPRAVGPAPRGAPPTPRRRRCLAAANRRRRRSWDACAPPWRPHRARRAPPRPAARDVTGRFGCASGVRAPLMHALT